MVRFCSGDRAAACADLPVLTAVRCPRATFAVAERGGGFCLAIGAGLAVAVTGAAGSTGCRVGAPVAVVVVRLCGGDAAAGVTLFPVLAAIRLPTAFRTGSSRVARIATSRTLDFVRFIIVISILR